MNSFLTVLTKMKIHPLFWGTFIIGMMTANFMEIIYLFVMVFIHELGHIFVAQHFKWRITKIELLPFGAVAEVDEYGNKPLKEEILILLAGPLQHIWLALAIQMLFQSGYIGEEIYHFLFWNNLSLFIFNLLPVWPLDGGKLLFCFLSFKLPFQVAHQRTIVTSLFSLGIFISATIFFSPTNITMWCMIVFLGISMYIEWKQRKFIFIRFLLNRFYGERNHLATKKKIPLNNSDKLLSIFAHFQRGCQHFIVVENKIVTEGDLLHAYFVEKKTNHTIKELFT